MAVTLGDIVALKVTHVAGYACWGITGGQIGFAHCIEWSWLKPVPDEECPKVGDTLRVKVVRVIDRLQEQLPADVTREGRIKVDFIASARLAHPERDPWRDPTSYRVDDVFVGQIVERGKDGCCFQVRHPEGATGFLFRVTKDRPSAKGVKYACGSRQ